MYCCFGLDIFLILGVEVVYFQVYLFVQVVCQVWILLFDVVLVQFGQVCFVVFEGDVWIDVVIYYIWLWFWIGWVSVVNVFEVIEEEMVLVKFEFYMVKYSFGNDLISYV